MLAGANRRLSTFFWILAWSCFALAIGLGFLSAYIEVYRDSPVSLFFMVGCALFLGVSGLFATVAAKFQAEAK